MYDDAELAQVYARARGKSPVWKQFLESWGVEDTLEDFLAKKGRLICLRLDLARETTPAPLKTDLIWVWPAGFIGALLIWLIAR